jgi:hypothetical protein
VTYTAAGGWFTNVNGHGIVKHPLPANILSSATSWAAKGPQGIVFHYQAGCGSDIYQVEVDRGYPIIAFNVALDGTIRQYMDARAAPWHCYDVSRYALGVEHAALPGSCELNDTQLTASAALFAALIEWTKDTYGIVIPVAKTGPITTANYKTLSGIFGHVDITPGSSLNPTGHTDTLYHWTWPQYLAAINANGDDVTPAQAKTIADAEAFLTALRSGLGMVGDKTKPASPTGAGQRVATSTATSEAPAGGVPKHQHTVKGTAS